MRELKILEQNAIAAYRDADNKGKSLLTKLFGEKVFSQTITDRVRTFDDVLEVAGLKEADFLEACGSSPDNIAYEKLKLITQVLNEGWTPNWNDGSETKYWPWFYLEGGFSFDYVGNGYRLSVVGSRLCFKNSALAKYAAQQFLDIYQTYFVIQ